MLEQLGDRHPFIDLERLGIYGHSGGGFMSTAAMLVCESPGSLQSLLSALRFAVSLPFYRRSSGRGCGY